MSAHTKKSDTVPERYAHIPLGDDFTLASHATVFARVDGGNWLASVAYCSKKDQFSRRVGRNVARRKFFSPIGLRSSLGTEFTFEAAQKLAVLMAP